VEVSADLILIALPPGVVLGHAGAGVLNQAVVAAQVPPAPRRYSSRAELVCDRELLRRGLDPGEERLPQPPRLLGVEPLTDHRELEGVVGLDLGLLAPMRIEEMGGVEVEELREQLAESRVR
jgi:hypothetical protein